jgi:3-phenylpropionate/trans-cinnamate dioxygenase ferredoxin reductase component
MPGTSPGRVVIVGGGAAAMRCAFELRDLGCEDHLEMLCAEDTPPYDRTLVSKALISGDDVGPERLMLAPAQAYADQDIELRLGSRATALDVPARRLTLADGSRVAFDRLVLCMGGEPVRPPRLTVDGVVTLRDLGDAQRLAPMLDPGRRVVIVGGGFIGTEVANMTVTRGLDTTVVEAELPFASLLGEHVAQRLCAMHRRRGVTLLTGTPVDRVRRDGSALRVDLVDGRRLPADVVVVAVGMRPATSWLAGSPLGAEKGIPTDACGRTSVPGIFAAGDCALVLDTVVGGYATSEHWEVAGRQGKLAARSVLGLPAPRSRAPYFWSDQLGTKLQLIGRTRSADSVELEEAEPAPGLIARYRRQGRLVAVFAAGAPRAIGQASHELDRSPSEAETGASEPLGGPREFAYPAVIELARGVARPPAGRHNGGPASTAPRPTGEP